MTEIIIFLFKGIYALYFTKKLFKYHNVQFKAINFFKEKKKFYNLSIIDFISCMFYQVIKAIISKQ